MSTIILSRHGKPEWDYRTPIRGNELGTWIHGLDMTLLDAGTPPPAVLIALARSADLIISSPLRRSADSAHWLVPRAEVRVEALCREVYLPTAIRSEKRLRPKIWTAMARARWYAGWSPGVESFAEARARATLAARALIEVSATHDRVFVAGHGLMNGLIARRLRRAGWSGPHLRTRRFWSHAIYMR